MPKRSRCCGTGSSRFPPPRPRCPSGGDREPDPAGWRLPVGRGAGPAPLRALELDLSPHDRIAHLEILDLVFRAADEIAPEHHEIPQLPHLDGAFPALLER